MRNEAMRTTLQIDDDVFQAAKAIAERKNRPLGEVISDLVRKSLVRPIPAATRNGIPLLPRRPDSSIVTLETVNGLRDELP